MKTFKVLGSGCSNCTKTAHLIESLASELSVEVTVVKVTDMETIMSYQVMRTPAVVYNEQVIHAGGIPSSELVAQWIRA